MDTLFSKEEDNQQPLVIQKYASKFKWPIQYLEEDVYMLNETVEKDLEIVSSPTSSVYNCIFSPKEEFSKQLIEQPQLYYTTNTNFLKDTQQIIQKMDTFPLHEDVSCEEIQKNWTNVKHDPRFHETYGFVEWEMLRPYNQSSWFMQFISVTSMMAPVFSFIIPFLFFLFPFFILKLQGVPISFSVYLNVLKSITKHHFIGRALTTFDSFTIENLVYLLVTFFLYALQMYQNTMYCLRYYKNTQRINDELCTWKTFVDNSILEIESYTEIIQTMSSYNSFGKVLRDNTDQLYKIKELLNPVNPFACSLTKTSEIGYMLKVYYTLHTDEDVWCTLEFCMGFHGYLRLLKSLQEKVSSNSLSFSEFSEDALTIETIDASGNKSRISPNTITQQYYPHHMNLETCVKNDVVLDEFGIITGPNASGKTTYLKTTAINIILTQQFGCGFYESCTMFPYTHIHSYLNIPDTSGRDSLFQSESRRCKEILDLVEMHGKNHRHFCIFDELYSGTNPSEATKAAFAFLEYLRKYTHVDLFLTTHYVSICGKWTEDSSLKPIRNLKMVVKEEESLETNQLQPTYKIEPGISTIEGAKFILKEMDYPQAIIDNMFDIDI